ncbi:hypothetical protein CSAL01_13773 [Colletotrichum salicis]|uniref:Uncharacterized protein n=1 Tax=Colletotrichum salicis TaxID=1209931 RepID=A0A135V7K5_9PEZI|nr:hypothetical protein CSAL01_13773 [Colletotrichum salicis]
MSIVLNTSAPLVLDRFDARAIVAHEGTPAEWRDAFRSCGIRLGETTNVVDSRAGHDAKIRQLDAGLEIMLRTANPTETLHIMQMERRDHYNYIYL